MTSNRRRWTLGFILALGSACGGVHDIGGNAGCSPRGGCGVAAVCIQDECRVFDGPCATQADCGSWEQCTNRVCRIRCTDNENPCPTGYSCANNSVCFP
jgi:hypothetical protein